MPIEELLAAAVVRLEAAGARTELLVDLVRPRVLGVPLAPRLVVVERVWRLGVVLLGPGGRLYATGTTLRVTEPRHPNAQSRLAEERRELRAIALKSGISGGETIDLDAIDIQLDGLTRDTRPLALIGGEVLVRWSDASEALAPFETYLADRVALLIDPPDGA